MLTKVELTVNLPFITDGYYKVLSTALVLLDYTQSAACGNIMKGGLTQMITRQCVCRAETHARDLWSAANKPGSCSVVVSNPPCGSSGLYFCPAYLWDSERVRRREKKKITSFLVGAIKALLSSILIRVLMLCLSHGFLCLLKGYVYSADPALEVQPWTETQQEKNNSCGYADNISSMWLKSRFGHIY